MRSEAMKRAQKRYQEKNPEAVKRAKKKYEENNPEAAKNRQKKYRERIAEEGDPRRVFKLSYHKQLDSEVVEQLEAQASINGYVKELVLKDIALMSYLEEGAKVLSKALSISAPAIAFAPSKDMPTPTTRAVTKIGDKAVIWFNSDVVPEQIEFTLAHELRHVYQYEYFTVHKDEQAKKWRAEFEAEPPKDLAEYNLRDIEVDANAFAISTVAKIKGIDLGVAIDYLLAPLDEEIKEKVLVKAFEM